MNLPESLEERVINEEYRVWKKNSLQLYDLIITHGLEWPSLAVEWLPQVVLCENESVFEHRLLLGTHTSGDEANHLILTTLRIPASDPSKVSHLYDNERQEWGGYEASPLLGQLRTDLKIRHDREVNRIQHMPQNPCVIGTFSATGDVLVFDYTKHSNSSDTKDCKPQLRLKRHSKEGYALAWSPHTEGLLLSGADDNSVCLWDIAQATTLNSTSLVPLMQFNGHSNIVNAVDWHKFHPFLFGSVSDDKKMNIWDTRRGSANASLTKPSFSVTAHPNEVNTLAFSPHNQHIIATGSADKTIALWDIRNLKQKLHVLKGHTDSVIQVKWSPHYPSILASSSADRRINVWDLTKVAKINNPTEPDTTANTSDNSSNLMKDEATKLNNSGKLVSPELIFIHAGHTARVSDFDWNPTDPFVIASVSEDNLLQVWQMREEFYKN